VAAGVVVVGRLFLPLEVQEEEVARTFRDGFPVQLHQDRKPLL